ncbi:MAG: hypothetical protein ABW163_06540 [Luteimonas sp.]
MSPDHRPVAAPRAKALALGVLTCAALAACAPADPDAPAPENRAAVQDPAPISADAGSAEPASTAVGATIGGDGSEIVLDGLTESDLGGVDLAGELACSFSTGAGAQALLLARGDVGTDAPAQGVVKVAGHVEQIRAPGGFDGLTRTPTFTGQGKTIRIEQTGDAIGGGESPPRPATLTYLRADGASRVLEGQWQCGP